MLVWCVIVEVSRLEIIIINKHINSFGAQWYSKDIVSYMLFFNSCFMVFFQQTSKRLWPQIGKNEISCFKGFLSFYIKAALEWFNGKSIETYIRVLKLCVFMCVDVKDVGRVTLFTCAVTHIYPSACFGSCLQWHGHEMSKGNQMNVFTFLICFCLFKRM